MPSIPSSVQYTLTPLQVNKELAKSAINLAALTPESETAQIFTCFFPHGYDFIYAKDTKANGKADWKTETRYPLSPRRLYDEWQDNDTLIGVRFGTKTAYGMLDIDKGSPYHPHRSEQKFRGIVQVLENIGLVRPLIIQSSFSEGLHIYYPLPESVSSFELACGMKACLQSHGYEIADGVLELFPNTKAYDSQFKAHRLPLQKGSYMLNDDLEKIGNDLEQFVFIWQMCQDSQDIDLLKEAIAEAKANYKPPKLSRKTDDILKWRDNLEKQIADGWTGKGQSNQLLYLMGKYARVFLGCADVDAIAKYITKTARTLAGFAKFCSDIHRLESKARDVAKWCLEHHFPWGSKKTQPVEDTDMSKADRQAERKERIRLAVSELKNTEAMPSTIRGMAQAIAKTAKVSVETLYDNKDLWHPEFTETTKGCNTTQAVNSSLEPPLDDAPTKSTENQSESNVTEKPLYEALSFFEMSLREQELPKFAKSPVTEIESPPQLPELEPIPLPRSPQKANGSMWVETHGRLKSPKSENTVDSFGQNSTVATANAACLQTYQPQNQAVSIPDDPKEREIFVLDRKIASLKTRFEINFPPISSSERSRLESELCQLESDRKNASIKT
jgi:hypothetical protein